ncbi:hypothetical protein CEE45_07280 [Candidatus Heimdallarchaeota archaeon B3_Heim]|nr:MAG: hypothetical protein CEE45_07280 [Candidatus Heimdallarchaeota archaeon B3_Heim]
MKIFQNNDKNNLQGWEVPKYLRCIQRYTIAGVTSALKLAKESKFVLVIAFPTVDKIFVYEFLRV